MIRTRYQIDTSMTLTYSNLTPIFVFDLVEERVPYHILLETTIQRMNPQVAIHLHLVHMFLQGKIYYMCLRIG